MMAAVMVTAATCDQKQQIQKHVSPIEKAPDGKKYLIFPHPRKDIYLYSIKKENIWQHRKFYIDIPKYLIRISFKSISAGLKWKKSTEYTNDNFHSINPARHSRTEFISDIK